MSGFGVGLFVTRDDDVMVHGLPPRMPAARVAIGRDRNAGLLAVQIPDASDAALGTLSLQFKARLASKSRARNQMLARAGLAKHES